MIPKEVNICGVPYEIEVCNDNFDLGEIRFGQIMYKESKIRINADLIEPMMNQTLCHEIMHGILVHIGYSELSADEQFVQALAMAVNQTFDVKGSAGC